MKQICDGYNPRVRMGNWFEQSYAVAQLSRTDPQKQARQPEIDIGYIDAHLKLRPLNTIARLPPWNTKGLVEAPQFKDLTNKTSTKENHDITINANYFNKWKPQLYEKGNGTNQINQTYLQINQYNNQHNMFNQNNTTELINQRNVNTSTFRSQLKPNQYIHPSELLQSTYQKDISDKMKTEYTSTHSNEHPQPTQSNFRRIRSEITLNKIPFIPFHK